MVVLRHAIFSDRASAALPDGGEGWDVCEERRRFSMPRSFRWQLALALIAVLISFPLQARTQHSRSNHPAQPDRKARNSKGNEPTLQVSRINDSNLRDAVGPHAEGEAVVRAAILLDRLKFSPGEISSGYNDNLAKAIAAFQSASGLRALGLVDPPTWAALNNDQAKGHVEQTKTDPGQKQQPANQQQKQGVPPQAVITYTITVEDASGPFTHLPQIRGHDSGERLMLKEAQLPRLNYGSSLELLAEKFHVSPRLLVQLNPGKRFDKEGEHIEVPNVLTPAPPKAASVVVDASTHSVAALESNGQVLAFYPATVGSEHDPLPVGNWTIAEVNWHPRFKYNPNLFWDAEDKRPRATLAPGPKNPVGVVWIGLSKKHYGIHGTPQPSQIGRTQSHGCIRLTNWDAAELANMVQVGTPAILEEGTPSEVKSQPSSSQ
jgi:lipoprotein-anchoring transpeptidase ErfK/SrfK